MIAHLRDWARERFPLANGAFFALLYLLALFVGRSANPGPIEVSWRDLPGLVALWSFFLWLRVLDEHKDFESDRIAHPDRVLQRGLVTLKDLRVLGGVALVIQLVVSVWLDRSIGVVTGWWLVSVVWSLLMAKEFFVREWLRRHIMCYAFSHMVVMLPLVAWVASMGSPDAYRAPSTWMLASLVYASGLAFEMGRKIRAPDDEHPSADSYTQSLGIGLATLVLGVVVAIVSALTLVTTSVVDGRIPPFMIVAAAAGAVLAVAMIHRFRQQPGRRAAKRVEAGVGVSILAMHGALLATVIQLRSVAW
jgi:UbiA prenyltransferase family